jgi:hypothetical protein
VVIYNLYQLDYISNRSNTFRVHNWVLLFAMASKPTHILIEFNEAEPEEPVTEQPKDTVSCMIEKIFLVI